MYLRGSKGSSSSSSSSSSESVALPRGMTAGAVIGRKGANIKMLRQRSGANFSIQEARVVVSGPPDAVRAGVQLLKAQVEAFMQLGNAHLH
jgi:hypothetical protein